MIWSLFKRVAIVSLALQIGGLAGTVGMSEFRSEASVKGWPDVSGQVAAATLAPQGIGEDWRIRTGSSIVGDPHVGTDGRIYVPLASGELAAYSAAGRELWRYPIELSPGRAGESLPIEIRSIKNGTVYVSSAGVLHAIDAEGKEKWKYAHGSVYLQAIIVREQGTVHLHHALRATTLNPDGKLAHELMFVFQLAQQPVGDKVYALVENQTLDTASLSTGGAAVYKKELTISELTASGYLARERKLPEEVTIDQPYAASNGVLYVMTRKEANRGQLNDLLRPVQLHAYSNGTITFSYELDSQPMRFKEGKDGIIYIVTAKGSLYALDQAGKALYTSRLAAEATAQLRGRPFVQINDAGEVVIAGSLMHASGEVQASESKLWRFGTDGKLLKSEPLPSYVYEALYMGAEGVILRGQQLWRFDRNFEALGTYPIQSAYYAVAATHDAVYVGTRSGELIRLIAGKSAPPRLVTGLQVTAEKVELQPGEQTTMNVQVKLAHGGVQAPLQQPVFYANSPGLTILQDGTVYAMTPGEVVVRVEAEGFEASLTIVVVEKQADQKLDAKLLQAWKFEVPATDEGNKRQFQMHKDKSGRMYAQTPRNLYALDMNGQVRWTHALNLGEDEWVELLQVLDDGNIYISTTKGKLVILDQNSGDVAQGFTLRTGNKLMKIEQAQSGMRIAALESIQYSNNQLNPVNWLQAFHSDHKLMWETQFEGRLVSVQLNTNQQQIYVQNYRTVSRGSYNNGVMTPGTSELEILSFDAETGKKLWTFKPEHLQQGALVTLSAPLADGTVIIKDSRGMLTGLGTDGKSKWTTLAGVYYSQEQLGVDGLQYAVGSEGIQRLDGDGKLETVVHGRFITLVHAGEELRTYESPVVATNQTFTEDLNRYSKYTLDGLLVWQADLVLPQHYKPVYTGDETLGFWSEEDRVFQMYRLEVTAASPVPQEEARPQRQSPFKDLELRHWAAYGVLALVEQGIVNGYSDGTFRPNTQVTREEFVKMLVDSLTNSPNTQSFDGNTSRFADVPSTRWSAPYVAQADALGILLFEQAEFRPQAAATRGEIAVWLAEALQLAPDEGDLSQRFTDTDQIAAGQQPYIGAAAREGLIGGYPNGTFGADKTLTRAEAAVLLVRAQAYQARLVSPVIVQ